METKDWLTAIGITLTFIISCYSLLINIRNRKNAIREHLYKEQVKFFLSLGIEFTAMGVILNNFFSQNEELKKTYRAYFLEKAQKIDDLLESNNFIIPNDHYLLISKTISTAYKVYDESHNHGKPINILWQNYSDAYSKMEDEIREFIGVDYLSDENRKLIGGIKLELKKGNK